MSSTDEKLHFMHLDHTNYYRLQNQTNVREMLEAEFNPDSIIAVEEEIARRTLKGILLTKEPKQSNTAVALALYVVCRTQVLLAILHTNEDYRSKGACTKLVHRLSEFKPGKYLMLEVAQFSKAHAVFEKIGFRRSCRRLEQFDTQLFYVRDRDPIVLEYQSKSPSLFRPYGEYSKNAKNELEAFSRRLETLQPSSLLHGVEETSWAEVLLIQDEHSMDEHWRQIEEVLPSLVQFDLEPAILSLGGKDYSNWLKFQLKKIYLNLAQSEASFSIYQQCMGWKFPDKNNVMASFNYYRDRISDDALILTANDLMLLNGIAAHTDICFVPVFMLGDQVVQMKSSKGCGRWCYVFFPSLEEAPKVLSASNLEVL